MRHGLGFHNRHSAGGFQPISLFTGGVQGAWYDPSDLTTLFSDRAGTTPCGTPGQGSVVPVGLMLDKSQGLVLGSELVSGTWANGTAFPFDTFTASGTGFTGNKTGFGYSQAVLPTAILVTTGKIYCLTAVVAQATDDVITIGMQDNSGGGGVGLTTSATFNTVTSSTTIIRYLRATANGTAYLQFTNFGTSVTLNVTSVSVRELAGNHAIAANDTTARPELSARVNLLLRSEEFDNAYWSKGNTTVTANAAVAPDGTTTADLIYPSVTGTFRSVYRAFSGANSISISVKASGKTWISMVDLAGSSSVAWFDVANGVIGTVTAGYTAAISSQGSGWYRCTLVANSGTFAYAQFNVVDGNGTNTGTANGTDGVLLWGADGRPTNIGTTIPAYQRIVDANTYDAVGFPRYLACNGTSSAMSTPGNVNLSGTDKATVFAGVRKLSDAGTQAIAELSANFGTNAGTFAVFAADPSGANYYAGLQGTTIGRYRPATYTAPISNVLAVGYDIGAAALADEIKPRVNGVLNQADPSGGAGTGNFGTYPLFIGARNNASLFFNGNIYSLIVVGSAVSAGQISATEQWVAQRTGITI